MPGAWKAILTTLSPMAGNTVVKATDLGVHPEKAALAVMVEPALQN